MKKIAVFVEGQSELIFVREYLLKQFEYQGIDLECRNLFKDEIIQSADYDFPNADAIVHFQIINVGNDTSVLQRILKREQLLWNAGYERIIGLRDMYSNDYVSAMGQPRGIKPDLNLKFIDGINKTLGQKAIKPQNIDFHFAIMELEAWFLGIENLWKNKGIDTQKIKETLSLDLSEIDPETIFLHPTEAIKDILKIINQPYRKQASEVESMMGCIEKQDFEDLRNSQKCNSFKEFTSSLTIT
ncbi:MAG: DUF4276 family protein [Arcicella sp.]|nr:DUF4276 family protein [Arcicella sp.]